MLIGINCDMGEGYGIYKVCDDEEMMKHITIANVACGYHAADPVVMNRTVELAKAHNVKVGAHPSYPDRQGFGRREMKIDRDELRDLLIYQIGALKGFLDAHGLPLNHIKPHGALYGVAARDALVANAVCDAAEVFGVPLYGMANTEHERVYRQRGMEFVAELYADLNYEKDGRLIITREHEPVTPRSVIDRCVKAMEEGVVDTVDNVDIKIDFDVICVHSDTPGAVEAAKSLMERMSVYIKN